MWNDPASAALSTKALINDLDLIVEQVSSGQTFQSWILSVFPHRDSLLLPARKGRDSLNNVEQVLISSPIAGEYKIKIKSGLLQGGIQPYAIVWEYKTMGSFQWMYPSLNTQLEAGVSNMLRWESAFPTATTGKLEWSTDSITWNLLERVTDVSKQSISWSTPVAVSNAWLRIIIDIATDA